MATTTKKTTTASSKKSTKVVKTPTATKTSDTPVVTSVKTNVKTSVKSKKAQLTPLERLKGVHTTAAVMYLIFAGLVIGFVTTAAKAVTLPIAARDEFASKDNVVLGSAHEVLYSLEPKHVLVAS